MYVAGTTFNERASVIKMDAGGTIYMFEVQPTPEMLDFKSLVASALAVDSVGGLLYMTGYVVTNDPVARREGAK